MLKEQINADFMTAFKAKEMEKKNFLGVLKSEIMAAESRPDFKDSETTAMQVVKKMEKSLLEMSGSESQALIELEYLKPYLPKMMERTEIVNIVTEIIASGAATNIGAVMSKFNQEHAGKADNKIVKEVALELL